MTPTLMRPSAHLAVLLPFAFLAACGNSGPPPAMPPPEVGVVTVEERPAPVDLTYMARTAGVREVEVRARVNGILQRRQYEEGTRVKEGALLFRIDPAPYEADASKARAQVGVAQAAYEEARRDRDRAEPLLSKGVVSRRDYDQAISGFESAKASLDAARAALKTAELNLSYTEVRAPISGLTSRERRSEGSLISMDGDSNLLTRIVQTDPLYIEFSMPSAEAAMIRGSIGKEGVHVVAIGADGKELTQQAKLTFLDTAVEQSTGLVQARATLPNKDGAILPGQFLRARIVGVDLPKMAVVPSRSVMRNPMGAMVMVVGEGDAVQPRPVQLGDTYGNDVAALSGVKAGDRVIADGLFKVDMQKLFDPQNKEPVKVKPVPSTAGQTGQQHPQQGQPPAQKAGPQDEKPAAAAKQSGG